jgi:hypothetical protein
MDLAPGKVPPGWAEPPRGAADPQPVTGRVVPTGVGTGAEPEPEPVGVGLGLVLVGVGRGRVAVGVGVGVSDGKGLVPVGVGKGLVPVGVGIGLVGVGVGVGLVAVGVGVGVGVVAVGVGVGVGVVAVGVGVGVGVVAVGVGVGVGVVAVGVGVGVGVVAVGVGVGITAQLDAVIVSWSRVTAPFWASARPEMVSSVCTVIDVRARMLPTKVESVPRVAELPTCQKTLQAWAPLVRMMELAESVVSVEGAWKIQTAFGSPCPSRVSDPPTSSEEEALYTPGASVSPAPMKAGTFAVGLRPAASLYAVVKSDWAFPATRSARWIVPPVTMPGGNPVTAVPGLTPRFPLIRLTPVLVTVVPPRTAKLPAVPRPTGAVAATAGCMAMKKAMAPAITGPAASQR